MNESLLREIINKFKSDSVNIYNNDSRTNITKLIEMELNELQVQYKKKKRKYKKGQYYFEIPTDNSNLISIVRNSYPNNNKLGWKISNNKLLTEKFLQLANIKTPNTVVFSENEFELAEKHVNSIEGKFIIKPLDLSQSLGVYLDIPKNKFKDYWNSCIAIQKRYKKEKPNVIIQDYVDGMELRIVVNEGELGSATIKMPGFIIGDGIRSINDLIDERNQQLQTNPYLMTKVIKKDDSLVYNLRVSGRSMETKLKAGEVCILFPESNIGAGRTFFEVTKYIHPNIMKQALDASKAIPGLQTTGIDIIIENFESQEGTIIEVNKSPAYQLNYFPEFGTPTNPLNSVLRSVIAENKILDENTSANNLSAEEVNILLQRYRFMHSKLNFLDHSLSNFLNNDLE